MASKVRLRIGGMGRVVKVPEHYFSEMAHAIPFLTFSFFLCSPPPAAGDVSKLTLPDGMQFLDLSAGYARQMKIVGTCEKDIDALF